MDELKNGHDEQVRKLQDARTAGRKVVVFYWGLQNFMKPGSYTEAVVGICGVLRGWAGRLY